MKIRGLIIISTILAAIVFIATACSIGSRHYRSSVIEFLYPDKKEPIEKPGIPVLSLPIRVAIAFVPESQGNSSYQPFMSASLSSVLAEAERMDLMKKVGDHFKQNDFVKSIELVPSAYLQPKGSFTNLEQISTMYGTDIIALISYDQTQFTGEGASTLAYWTIVGAYIVNGEKNDTHTMVDAAVFDIKSRKLLFRAPGISHIKSSATPVNLSAQMKIDSKNGFVEASEELITNLDEQLKLFKERVKEEPEEYKIIHKPGYTGGGSLDALFLVFIAILGVIRLSELMTKKV